MLIVVGGYIVGFPFGGMTWHHLNYLAGLHELGHEVWFIEDSGSYSLPYNPTTWTSEVDSTYGRAYLERALDAAGLPKRYCYYSEFENRHYGLSEQELHDLLTRADLLLCVSGVTPLRDSRPRPRRAAVIDTDPVLTQIRMLHDRDFATYFRSFDAIATFGRLIGKDNCNIPTHDLRWIPTQQPISLRHWPVATDAPVNGMTTIGRWEHGPERSIEFDGRKYHSAKSTEWRKLITLAQRSPIPLALAMAGVDGPAATNTLRQFEAAGWKSLDAQAASISPEAYQQFLRSSAGEFTVAKEIYAQLPSGWFSDRSAAYLASGRPVVTQATGFEHWLPTGEGLFAFDSLDSAAHALDTIAADYPRHAAAARRIAEEYFDARKVLGELLRAIM
jgi:hypothetical protein